MNRWFGFPALIGSFLLALGWRVGYEAGLKLGYENGRFRGKIEALRIQTQAAREYRAAHPEPKRRWWQ